MMPSGPAITLMGRIKKARTDKSGRDIFTGTNPVETSASGQTSAPVEVSEASKTSTLPRLSEPADR